MKKILFTLFTFHFAVGGLLLTLHAQSITWQRAYDGPAHRDDAALDITESTDGYFYVVGSTELLIGERIYVLKLNQYGDTIWTKIIGETIPGPGKIAYTGASSSDGGCVLTGSWDSAFTAKVNSDGTIGWLKFYGGSYVQLYDIINTQDGGYIACGRHIFEPYVLKIDSSGNLEWQRTYTLNYSTAIIAIEEAIDGGYIGLTPKKWTRS